MKFRPLVAAIILLLGCGGSGTPGAGGAGGHLGTGGAAGTAGTGGTAGTAGTGGAAGTAGTGGSGGQGGAGVACNVDGQVMTCQTGTGCCGGFGAVYTCQAEANCQPCSNLWLCDGPEDCPGQVCCYKNRSCEARGTTCTSDCSQTGDAVACHTPADCPNATPNCCVSATREYPVTCKAAACPP